MREKRCDSLFRDAQKYARSRAEKRERERESRYTRRLRFEGDLKFSDSIDRAAKPLLQVTPVNLVPEAVTTHGIRGPGIRARSDPQIIWTTKVFLFLLSSPFYPGFSAAFHPLSSPCTTFPFPPFVCLSGMHLCRHTVAQPRVRVTPTIPDNLAHSLCRLCLSIMRSSIANVYLFRKSLLRLVDHIIA